MFFLMLVTTAALPWASKLTYIWVLLLERVHQRRQVVVLVRHDDLVDVVQQHVAGALHGAVKALVEGGLLTEVVQVPATDRVLPAVRRHQVLVDGPRDHFHEALLAVNPQQAVQLRATRGVVDHHPAHTEQSAAKAEEQHINAVEPRRNRLQVEKSFFLPPNVQQVQTEFS